MLILNGKRKINYMKKKLNYVSMMEINKLNAN